MKIQRRFSIPFNGSDADYYISATSQYKQYIDSIYVGPPSLINTHANLMNTSKYQDESENDFYLRLCEYEENCYEFLTKSKGYYKRIIPINSGFYHFSKIEMQIFIRNSIVPIVEKYEVDGFILTDFNMACMIHKMFPELELHTSCNCFQWNIKTMDCWREMAGITVFNPPREILRSPKQLKEMHDEGFILKCLVNESCLYGCPQTINHCMYLADKNPRFSTNCNRNNISNIFRSNWVIPRWLDKLDKYVDIYKISGRNAKLSYIIGALDAYITGNDNINLLDLIIGGTSNTLKHLYPEMMIPVSDIPDKLLECECRECKKGCNVCDELMKSLLK